MVPWDTGVVKTPVDMFHLEVFGLPPPLNKFYAGTNHFERTRFKNEWRGVYFAAIKEARLPKMAALHLSVTEFCRGRVRDADSAVIAAKFFLDALVDAGVIEDDGPEQVKSVTLATRKGKIDRAIFFINPRSKDDEYKSHLPAVFGSWS